MSAPNWKWRLFWRHLDERVFCVHCWTWCRLDHCALLHSWETARSCRAARLARRAA